MNFDILRQEVQEYIYANADIPVVKLALTKNPFPDIAFLEILNQIAARQKVKDKLPAWYNTPNIVYPEKISVEQTSSESAARYKSSLVYGESLIDLTGGLGVDDYYFAEHIKEVIHCEINTGLSEIASHNFTQLKRANIQCIPGDSLETLKLLNRRFDYMYIDPARRSNAKGKVFMLKDCLPDVPALLDVYLSYTNTLLIKTAPLLDITAGLNELKFVKSIHIVAVNNEVKELLWVISKGYSTIPELIAVAIDKSSITFFKSNFESQNPAQYSLPQTYLYEPNSAIMKSGAFNEVSYQFGLNKLHQHSHLYTSDNIVDFPGRRFKIDNLIQYNKAEVKKHIESKKVNITTRNFPVTPDELRKKWKTKDGGDVYAFFTTNSSNEKIVLLCSKI